MEAQPRQVTRVRVTWNKTYSGAFPAYVLRSDQKVISSQYLTGSGNHEEMVLVIEEDVPTPK